MRVTRSIWLLASLGYRQQPGRAFYLIMTVTITVTAWLGLSAIATPFLKVAQQSATQNTLTVTNARSSQHMLPQRYAQLISKISGIEGFQYNTVQLVQCKSGQTITLNALGGRGLAQELRNAGFSAEDVRRWQSDRLGILLDAKVAKDCGWKQGMGIRPPTVVPPPKPIELHITGIAPPGSSGNGASAFVHYAYINKVAPLFSTDTVMSFSVTPMDPRHTDALAQRIQKAFAFADPPVAAYPDSVAENSWARFGKVQNLIALVMMGLFVCCALVLVSVLAHTAAERRRHVAVLQVIGYPRWLQLAGFALEHASIVALGAIVGIASGHYAPTAISMLLRGLFTQVTIPDWAYAALPAWLAVLWLLALATPSIVLWRVHPADCRKT